MEPNFNKLNEILKDSTKEGEDVFIPSVSEELKELAEIESDSGAMLAAAEDMDLAEKAKEVLSASDINKDKTEKELSSGNSGFSLN